MTMVKHGEQWLRTDGNITVLQPPTEVRGVDEKREVVVDQKRYPAWEKRLLDRGWRRVTAAEAQRLVVERQKKAEVETKKQIAVDLQAIQARLSDLRSHVEDTAAAIGAAPKSPAAKE